MKFIALFKSGNVEEIDISFYETTTDDFGVKIFVSSKMPKDLKNSATTGITDTFVLLRELYSDILPKAVCVNVKGFAKETIGNSSELAFAVAFAVKMFEHYNLGNINLPNIIAATGVINQKFHIDTIDGIKNKLIGAIENNVDLVIYPKENEFEFKQLKTNDVHFSNLIDKSSIKLIPVKSLREVFEKIGITKKNNFKTSKSSKHNNEYAPKAISKKNIISYKKIIFLVSLLLLISTGFFMLMLKDTSKISHKKTKELSYYVSNSGNDSNLGTESEPFKTISHGLTVLKPGNTLYIHGGTYNECITNLALAEGTESKRITIKNYNDEIVLIKGLLWLESPSYWTIDSLKVSWDNPNRKKSLVGERMVKISNGKKWVVKNCEFYGTESRGCMSVLGNVSDFKILNCYMHDAYVANVGNVDNILYLKYNGSGLIERSIFSNSPNGCGIKISETGTDRNDKLTIRYCTFYNNKGYSNVQIGFSSSNCEIYRNILQNSTTYSVNSYNLTGTLNKIYENICYKSTGTIKPENKGLIDSGGNVYFDPQFVDPEKGDFHTKNPKAAGYGVYAQ
jgi:hypothetical protein